jgi:hypothetical protein
MVAFEGYISRVFEVSGNILGPFGFRIIRLFIISNYNCRSGRQRVSRRQRVNLSVDSLTGFNFCDLLLLLFVLRVVVFIVTF